MYDVQDYDDPADFYYDHADEFDDIQDAEDYWRKHSKIYGKFHFVHILAESQCVFRHKKEVSVYEKSFLSFHAAGYPGSGTAAGDGAGRSGVCPCRDSLRFLIREYRIM